MTLDEIALKHGTDKASSHHSYCPIYEAYFKPWRDSPIVLLEIGVQFGHSAKTFLEYFSRAQILGVDIHDQFKTDNPLFSFYQGDIGDAAFWNSKPWAGLTIVIDDAPHVFESSVVAFDCLWPKLKSGGLYIIEDVFTWWDANYQAMFGGVDPERGLNTIGWIGRLLGNLNQNGKQYYGKPSPSEPLSGMETEIDFVHCHRGLIIIGKK